MAHWVLTCVALVVSVCAGIQHDNELVRDAMEAMSRHQNDIDADDTMIFKPHFYANQERVHSYPIEPNDIDYLRSIDPDEELTLPYEVFHKPDKLIYDYSENYPEEEKRYELMNPSPKALAVKRNPSFFRERTDHEFRPQPKVVEYLVTKPDEDNSDNDVDYEPEYIRMLQEYWDKYKAERELAERYAENEELGNKRALKRQNHQRTELSVQYPHSHGLVMKKRFPVSKRSSSGYVQKKSHKRFATETERSVSGTDPKVVRDLSHIFGNGVKPTPDKKSKTKKATEKKIPVKKSPVKKSTKTKEFVPSDKSSSDFPHINKKSIDWSNYFGIDKRRKKSSEGGDVDGGWMAQQYKNTLKDFESDTEKRKDVSNLDSIKNKLKSIEDLIIDEAIKYTGAHEGETDSKEVQEVKDKLMARLATAYNLEKMRRALGEFKKSVAEQGNNLSKQFNNEFDFDPDEHEVTTVGDNQEQNVVYSKKSDPTDGHKDNNVAGHSNGDNDCGIIDVVEQQCVNIAAQTGEEVVQPLCVLHQICSLCGMEEAGNGQQNVVESNSDLSCFYMFVSESEHACSGDTQCRRSVHYALNALRDAESPSLSPELCPRNAACVDNALESARHHIQRYNMRHI